MIATLSLIIGVVGVLSVVVYLIWRQGRNTARLRIENEAHREVDRIEKKARTAGVKIDADVQRKRVAAREFLSRFLKARKGS